MSLKTNFIANVKATCKDKGVSQAELARLSGFSEVHISRVFNGKSTPSIDFCEEIANAIGLPPAFVFVSPEALMPERI